MVEKGGVSGTARVIGQPSAPSVRFPKAAEIVADSIRRDVMIGKLEEGQTLPSEGALIDVFGVSRPTIREAFRILESEGFIDVRRGTRGARVRLPRELEASRSFGLLLQLRGATLADMWEARMVVEPALVRRLAGSRTATDLKQLRQSMKDQRQKQHDPQPFAVAASEFHAVLADLSDNRTLSLVAKVLDEVFRLHASEVAATNPDWLEDGHIRTDTLEEHENLIDLIEAQRADEAEAFWRGHVEASSKLMLKVLGATQVVELYPLIGTRSTGLQH
jgi:DNA-binding FadR family transcriptional regulator